MESHKYKLSFTSGAALIYESRLIAEQYLQFKDWKIVKEKVLTQNLLQARTENTSRKIYGEVSRRLKNLNDEELSLLVNSENNEKQIVWLAICRHYALIRDFAIEVLAEHYDKSRFKLFPDDYEVFLNAKAEWHDNLDNITQLTRSKSRQVIFKMLAECGLVNENKELLFQSLSLQLKALVQSHNIDDIRIYPGADV